MSVIWHDLECGGYAADLPLWRALAARYGDPVLEIGAGTGRVALALARDGHSVTALDLDQDLLSALSARGHGLDITTVAGDARRFDLGREFALCIVPMQTIQLLGGPESRAAFLRCARKHLLDGGVLAVAIADELDLFDEPSGTLALVPDVCELDGVVYSSRPTAVRADGDGFVLEREREIVTAAGSLSTEHDRIHLDQIDAAQLEREAAAAGLRPVERMEIAATEDHVGTVVVILGA